eukprot:TRINITY_DN3662_c0_g1_i1.p1 TRINITY_DN3662_c0_g1~~TRINITY_DN3662_c0_g1_i1.p1  ORF type:complete len:194 (-),score=43.20 TRINITY_DN3662_c0_g1_i1:114-695(-)
MSQRKTAHTESAEEKVPGAKKAKTSLDRNNNNTTTTSNSGLDEFDQTSFEQELELKISNTIATIITKEARQISHIMVSSIEKELQKVKGNKERFEREIASEREQLEKEKEEWVYTTQKISKSVPSSGMIKLNIGGTMFGTSVETLTTFKGSFFDVMFNGRFPLKKVYTTSDRVFGSNSDVPNRDMASIHCSRD